MEERELKPELKAGDGVKIDDKTTYEYGADLHTEGTQLIDPALGKTMTIRIFEFQMNPNLIEVDRQTLFNSHAKQISTILWGDGLVPFEQVPPRVIIDLKGKKYQIFVPCVAKTGTFFAEDAKSLSQHLTKPT